VDVLYEIVRKEGEVISVDVGKRIAVAKVSELSIWIRQLLAGEKFRTLFI